MSESKSGGGGIGLLGLLGIVFIILKLTNFITWSWWWVLSPFWLPITIVVTIVLLIFLIQAALK